jgi:hypothetical protein
MTLGSRNESEKYILRNKMNFCNKEITIFKINNGYLKHTPLTTKY